MIACAVSVMLYVANFLIFLRFNALGAKMNLDENHVFYDFIKQQLMVMNSAYLAISLVIISVLAFTGLMLSHRIAGPLFHFKRSLKEMGDLHGLYGVEDINCVYFRKRDYFKELTEDYNRHLVNLKEEHKKNQRLRLRLEQMGIDWKELEQAQVIDLHSNSDDQGQQAA